MELTPGKIYEAFLKNRLDKPSATKLLLSLIENSDNDRVRIESINELVNLRVKDDKTFKVLESLIISDSSEFVRNNAALALRNLFFDKSLAPMKWALIHEESPSCLKTIYDTLIQIIQNFLKCSAKTILLSEVRKIRKKEFKIGFEIISEKYKESDLSKNELASILINYFSAIFLEKTYWRLKYKIENCKITELDFIFKSLIKIPKALKNLRFLKTLILRYNQLTELPDWICMLTSLECLNLNINNLKSLPESIGELSSLKELHLWKNELKMLPLSIGSLSSLQILNLRLNQLNRLPDTIGKLSFLKELNLHDNLLTTIPESIGYLKNLQELNLSWNELTSIPMSIGQLNSLKRLDLGRNELKLIPDSIGSLSSLEILNLSENKLEYIPETIGSLSSLRLLDLSRNEIKNLPISLSNLTSLRELYIAENPLNYIPKDLEYLKTAGLKIYI